MSHNTDDASGDPDAETSDEKVGYKSPPKKYQFKKGESGNPRGSKKREDVDDVRIVMEDVLAELKLVTVPGGGKPRTVSVEEAIMEAELRNALSGDPKAIETLFKRAQKCGLFSKAKSKRGPLIEEMKGDDGKIIRMFNAERARAAAAESTGRMHKIASRKADR
jgi:hypothetical protein